MVRMVRIKRTSVFLFFLLVCFFNQEINAAEDKTAPSQPVEVKVAFQLDQITDVDQKEENFSVVGNFIMGWEDKSFAFDPAECDCDEKVFSTSQFEKYTSKEKIPWPRFLFYNQQGNRWIQEDAFRVKPDGSVGYLERSSMTLQAPDFNFLQYPFDTQTFNIRIVSLRADNKYVFIADPNYNRMGSQLGEEEWQVNTYRTFIDKVELVPGKTNSRFTFTFPAHRHIDYYVYRIFLPLALIVLVAYATFFMLDYSKRVDYAAANLLTFVMFNFAVSSDLPRLGYLTFTDCILVISFIITAVTVVSNVVMRRLSVTEKEHVARKWDGIILWGYPLLYVAGLVWALTRFF